MLDGASVRFVAAVEGPAAVRVASRLGRTMPAHCTSTGKVMLAQLSPPELRALLPRERLERITSHSIASRAELEAELSGIRERGYATNREESEEGVASVAVPIRPGRPACGSRSTPPRRNTGWTLPVPGGGRRTCQRRQGDWRSARLARPATTRAPTGAAPLRGARPPRR